MYIETNLVDKTNIAKLAMNQYLNKFSIVVQNKRYENCGEVILDLDNNILNVTTINIGGEIEASQRQIQIKE